jgi:hypothetical protein
MTEAHKNPVGRPNELLPMLEKAKAYLLGEWEIIGDVIPSIAGLACYCGKTREAIYNYQRESTEFSDIVSSILALQENKLLNGGLNGSMNASITKLILTKHNYNDKVETDHKSSDLSMSPTRIEIVSVGTNSTNKTTD